MKVRGTTITTPVKPEAVVVKCKNLNEEEKAQARENIGAADADTVRDLDAEIKDIKEYFDETGGITVFIDRNTGKAGYTSEEIKGFVDAGSPVMLDDGYRRISLSSSESDYARFVLALETGEAFTYIIDADGNYTFEETNYAFSEQIVQVDVYLPQERTEEEKAQARENIGLGKFLVTLTPNPDGPTAEESSWRSSHTSMEIAEHIDRPIVCISKYGNDFLAFDGITNEVTNDGLRFYAHYKSAQDDKGVWTEYIVDPEGAVTLKQHKPEVFANALKGYASGEAVGLNDVSPFEHEMSVKLSSDTVEDFSSVTVTKRGFNWFDQDTRFALLGYVKQEDGSWLGDTYHGTLTTPPVQVQGAVYIQATVKNTGLRGVPLSLKASYTDGTIQTLIQVTADMTEFTRLKGVSQENKTLKHIQITYGGDSTVTKGAFYICNVMMSYADGEYVPYTAETQVFASNADGTVKGISGNGEPMTLTTDTQGVTITAEYNKDTNKVIENLVQAIISLGGNV